MTVLGKPIKDDWKSWILRFGLCIISLCMNRIELWIWKNIEKKVKIGFTDHVYFKGTLGKTPKNKLWTGHENICQTWGQTSSSYLDHECTRHIISPMISNMVSQCQTKKSYELDTNLHRQKDRQADGQTEWFLYTPWTSIMRGIISENALTIQFLN